MHWRRLVRFLADERGASYALPYVLTFPIYLLLVCLMIQPTLILMVKMGTMYAAHAAARAAIVWRSDEPEAQTDAGGRLNAEEHAFKAAYLAMTPFTSSSQKHYDHPEFVNHSPKLDPVIPTYHATYLRRQQRNVDRDDVQPARIVSHPDQAGSLAYIEHKIRVAAGTLHVDMNMEPNGFNRDVTAKVRYNMPMHIPGAGRILGVAGPDMFFAREISSVVTLPSETPKSANKRLGICYDSHH